MRELVVDEAGRLVARSLSGRFASTDQGVSWTALAAEPASPPPPPTTELDAGPSEHLATVRDGESRWSLVRHHGMSSYEAPGDRGMPITHWATRVSTFLDGTVDGGATATRVECPGATALALDRSGRLWLASNQGVDVADARQVATGGATWRRALDRAVTAIVVDLDGRVVAGAGDTALLSIDGVAFTAIPPRATDRGSWGSLDCDARGFTLLTCAPDGRIWAVVGGVGGPHHIVRLSDAVAGGKPRWEALALGLNVIAGRGLRDGHLAVTALALTGDGTAFAATRSHGLFRRPP